MKGTAQQTRTTSKPERGAVGAPVQRKARVGAGNRHRADALALQAHNVAAPLMLGRQDLGDSNTPGQSIFKNQSVFRSAAGILQKKLSIGKANDEYEQEADRVADQVMRMPAGNHVASFNEHAAPGSAVQRKCSCSTTTGACDKCRKKRLSLKRANASSHEAFDVPASVHEVLRSSGQPLDSTTRAFMEPRFGYDFGDVRIHTNSAAARSARAVNALAFTVGNHIAFGSGQYAPGTSKSSRLLAHELAHVVQQGGAAPGQMRSDRSQAPTRFDRISEQASSPVSGVVQRADDPLLIPPGFPCPTDLTPGAPAGTDLLFPVGGSTIDAGHTAQLTAFVAAWVAAGGTDDILVHGYASPEGEQGANWTLSCDRAQRVRDALLGLGVPSVHLSIVAHGESTDFGASNAPNQHAVVTSSPGGLFSPPIVVGTLTPVDNFAGRSNTRFGVGEVINLDFVSFPPTPAADFGGLQWNLASGTGALTAVTLAGTATYTAPATADTVRLELRIASGAIAGRVVDRSTISIVEPSAVRMVEVAGTAPGFSGTIPAGTCGAGFQADVFVDPKDVSFQGVVFGEGTVAAVVTPAGSFQSPRNGLVHPVNTFGPGHAGNAITGTPVSPPVDNILSTRTPTGSILGLPTCGRGTSDFLWAIPWEFSVAGGARTRFPGGFTANHHFVTRTFCTGTIDKAGAGPFCRRVNGTTC